MLIMIGANSTPGNVSAHFSTLTIQTFSSKQTQAALLDLIKAVWLFLFHNVLDHRGGKGLDDRSNLKDHLRLNTHRMAFSRLTNITGSQLSGSLHNYLSRSKFDEAIHGR